VYVARPDGAQRFRGVKATTSAELARLTRTLGLRIGGHPERQGLLERDAENGHLRGDVFEGGPMEQLLASSITCRIAAGPQQVRRVFRLQTLPGCDKPFDAGVGKPAGSSLHAGVAARTEERKKLEWLCRYIGRPAVAQKRLLLATNGNIRYGLKPPISRNVTPRA
jgi:hypothetical protein